MQHIESVWQNVETMRDSYVKKMYDPTRGGQRLSKGHLYCPVFKDSFHALFFLDLPLNRVLSGVPDLHDVNVAAGGHNVIDVVPVLAVPNVNAVGPADAPVGPPNAPGTPGSGSKRPRMTHEGSD